MRFVAYAFLAIAGLLAAAVAFVYVALPTEFVRDEIAAQVLARTGRNLTVTGPISISVYPQTAIELDDVQLSPPSGMTSEPTVSVRALTVKVPFWPLLQHQLRIEQFVLDHPVIVLQTDAQGRMSWDFRKPASAEPQLRGGQADQAASAEPVIARGSSASPPAPRQIADFQGVQLRDVRLVSGTIQVVDERSRLKETLTDVSVNLGFDDIEGPAHLDGSLAWSGEPIAIQGTAGPVANLISGAPAALDLSITGRLAKTIFKGTLAAREATPLSGTLHTTAGSLRQLLAWLRYPLPPGNGLGATTLAADFGLSAQGFAARNAVATLDGMTVKGSFSVTRGSDRPMVRADLSLDRLDLNALLDLGSAPATLPAPAKPTKAPAAAAASATVASQPAASLAANSQGPGWSTKPIDVSALKLADADVALTVEAAQWQSIKLSKTIVKTGLKDGVMKSRFSEIALYGGKGTGSLVLQDAAPGAKVETNFALHGIQAQPFLSDAAGFDRIAGTGDLSFNFIGSGPSQLTIVKSLMGQGRMELADGAIVGFNAAAGVKALQNGNIDGFNSQPSAKTDFTSLTASCTITNGILDNRDLAISAPLMRLTGAGTANLADRTMDYTAQPTLVDSTEGQGATEASGQLGKAGLTIPVHLIGPWAKPSVKVDLKALAKNPEAAIETVKKAVGKFASSKQGKALGDILGGLLGKAVKPSDVQVESDPAPAQ